MAATRAPADHDEYWERGLAEMRAVNPQVELVPASFRVPGADCFDLYFTGVSGARVHAKYVRPQQAAEPHPAVVQFHGYSGSAGDWHDKLSYAAIGCSILALDCRGQGGECEDTCVVVGNTYRGHIIRGLDDDPDKLPFRQIFLDTAQLAGIAMGLPEVNGKRVYAIGAPQGGGLTLACTALEPRVAKAVPVFPFLCD